MQKFIFQNLKFTWPNLYMDCSHLNTETQKYGSSFEHMNAYSTSSPELRYGWLKNKRIAYEVLEHRLEIPEFSWMCFKI